MTTAAVQQTVRQQVLVLYLASSALDSRTVGWSTYDGTGATSPTTGDSDVPPYASGLEALKDGWRLFQAAQLLPPQPRPRRSPRPHPHRSRPRPPSRRRSWPQRPSRHRRRLSWRPSPKSRRPRKSRRRLRRSRSARGPTSARPSTARATSSIA